MTNDRELEVSDRIATIPNLLSAVRLLGVPLFLYLMLGPQADGWALVILLVSGGTDWLDGKLARMLGQASKLGAILDPLVDRLYVVSTLVAFVVRGIIPWWVAAILIGRDAVLGLTMFVYRRRSLPPPDVIYLGKAIEGPDASIRESTRIGRRRRVRGPSPRTLRPPRPRWAATRTSSRRPTPRTA